MKSAAQRVVEAKKRAERWRKSILIKDKQIAAAARRGNLTRVDVLKASRDRILGFLQKADKKLKKYEPIAAMAKRTERTEKMAAQVQPKWKVERKEAHHADRRARRLGIDRSGYQGARQVSHREGVNPFNGSSDLMAINTRHDVLEFLYSHRKISRAEKAAGDRFVGLSQAAEMRGDETIDHDRIGGGSGEAPMAGPTDMALNAVDQLARVASHLGARGYALLVAILHQGYAIKEIAAQIDKLADASEKRINKTDDVSKRDELYVGRRLRETLSDLADFWSTRGENSASMQFWRDDDARPTVRPDLWEKKTA